jgi:type II secretory pathway component PulC
MFWLAALVIVSAALAVGIGYRLWPKSKVEVVGSPKDVKVTPKDVVISLKDVVVSSNKVALKGILYSEDNPSALIGETIVAEGDIINGVKVVKINKDTVEFEKDGEKWTQRTK